MYCTFFSILRLMLQYRVVIMGKSEEGGSYLAGVVGCRRQFRGKSRGCTEKTVPELRKNVTHCWLRLFCGSRSTAGIINGGQWGISVNGRRRGSRSQSGPRISICGRLKTRKFSREGAFRMVIAIMRVSKSKRALNAGERASAEFPEAVPVIAIPYPVPRKKPQIYFP